MTFLDYNASGNGALSVDHLANLDTDQLFVNSASQLSTISPMIANATVTTRARPNHDNLLETLIIPLYGTIFLLSVVGNSLVLITLARNKRMRTVTNVYLLNLVSKLFLLFHFLPVRCLYCLRVYF